jgi:serine/threonine protein kinase
MKFSIEKINLTLGKPESKSRESVITKEKIEENIRNFCNEVLISEQEIGYGNFSNVYADTRDNGFCYKKFKPNAESRMNITAKSEMNFMEEVYGLDDEVKTPFPIGFTDIVMKNKETQKLSLIKIITMEHFKDSTRLEDVLEPTSIKLKKDFPESFDIEIFFNKLKSFIIKMHEEKGVYHRDLFSRNILIDNKTGNPIILDFGDAAFQPVDENYDPYGRRVYDNKPFEDMDLQNIESLRLSTLRYLTKTE